MAVDDRPILNRVKRGHGRALDLGGTLGARRTPLEALGYSYVNLDLKPHGERKVRGDAHRLPFVDGAFALVVCGDAFDSLTDPIKALFEIRRVLEPDGTFIFWAPFMHQFGGDDLYRFTPSSIEFLLERAGFAIRSLEASGRFRDLLSEAFRTLLRRTRFGSGDRPDHERRPRRRGAPPRSQGIPGLARSYVVVAGLSRTDVDRTTTSFHAPVVEAPPTTADRSIDELVPVGGGRAILIGVSAAFTILSHKGYAVETVDPTDVGFLPIETGSASLVVSTDGLGSFPDPFLGIQEIRRVLREEGSFVTWAPYLHPWRGTGYMRFTPLGFALLMRSSGFRFVSFEPDTKLFSAIANAAIFRFELKPRGHAARALTQLGLRMDRAAGRLWGLGYSFAGSYAMTVRAGAPTQTDLLEARKVGDDVLWMELGDEVAAAQYRRMLKNPYH